MPIKNNWIINKKKEISDIHDFDLIEPYLTSSQREIYRSLKLKNNHYSGITSLDDFEDEMIDFHINKLNALRNLKKRKYYFYVSIFLLIFSLFILVFF